MNEEEIQATIAAARSQFQPAINEARRQVAEIEWNKPENKKKRMAEARLRGAQGKAMLEEDPDLAIAEGRVSGGDKARAFAVGLGQAATLGHMPELVARAQQLGVVKGPEDFETALGEARGTLGEMQAAAPGAIVGGEAAGGLSQALVPGLAAAKILGKTAAVAPAAGSAMAKIGKRVLGGLKEGAAQTAPMAATSGLLSEHLTTDPLLALEEAAKVQALGTGLGGALGGAAAVAPHLKKVPGALASAGRKAGSVGLDAAQVGLNKAGSDAALAASLGAAVYGGNPLIAAPSLLARGGGELLGHLRGKTSDEAMDALKELFRRKPKAPKLETTQVLREAPAPVEFAPEPTASPVPEVAAVSPDEVTQIGTTKRDDIARFLEKSAPQRGGPALPVSIQGIEGFVDPNMSPDALFALLKGGDVQLPPVSPRGFPQDAARGTAEAKAQLGEKTGAARPSAMSRQSAISSPEDLGGLTPRQELRLPGIMAEKAATQSDGDMVRTMLQEARSKFGRGGDDLVRRYLAGSGWDERRIADAWGTDSWGLRGKK